MSCSTAYLVRDVDGVWRVRWQKYGRWCLLDPSDRDVVLEMMRERSTPLSLLSGPPWLSGWLCRGVLLDMVERRLRFYGCGAGSRYSETIERRIARSPTWDGWDVAYAWGGREDFAELVPEAAAQIEPEPYEQRPLDELADALLEWEDDSLVAWDRQSQSLRYRWAWWPNFGGLLSVIDERLDVLDFGFAYQPSNPVLLPWLLHGEPLLDALAPMTPHALQHERQFDDGVIIDSPARCIRYWSGAAIPPPLLASVRAAWPGWSLERLRFGYAGHLAATGRRDPDALIPDDKLPPPDFDSEWLRERATLTPDARGLRCIEEILLAD